MMNNIDRILEEINHNYAHGLCVHCGAEIVREQQVGRSVYNHPCGCRSGQGKARTADELAKCKENQ